MRPARLLLPLLAVLAAGAALAAPAPAWTGGVAKYSERFDPAGPRVFWWIPDHLRDGTHAPVVVVLHGFGATNPDLYAGVIRHITDEGLIAVFPQMNLEGLGLLLERDQNVFLARAKRGVALALSRIGSRAGRGDLVIWGHSLGGLVGAAWNPSGGPRARALVLANPSLGGTAPVPVTPIPIERLAPKVRVPVTILTGDQDRIAPPAEALRLHDLLASARRREVWEARTDTLAWPWVWPSHISPLSPPGRFGRLDRRFYAVALDAAVARRPPRFDFGTWPDGVPIRPPVLLAG